MNKFTLKPLVLSLALLYSSSIFAIETGQKTLPEKKLDTVVVEGSRIGKDEIGYNRVYTRDIVSLYKGKKELETYKGNTVSDLLTGMVGVYSGDARNSGALDPNIRGLQGQGRIPVTIDGTEQAITVWRGYAGVNNRNYVDPSLISSAYIEKGPSLNPKIRSGIGGSLTMKTIDADDIVQEGKKYGFEVKVETGNNSIKERGSIYKEPVDYRTLSNPLASQGGVWRMYFDGTDRQDQRFSGKNDFFKDKAIRIAAATKQENFDAMLAYAYRNKGNYFSGTKGAEKYGYDIVKGKSYQDMLASAEKLPTNEYISRIAVFYHPGGEVTNTSLNTSSWLGKTTFRLPNQQKIKLGARYTDTHFGEILPSRIFGPMFDPDAFNQVGEWNQAWAKQQAYNLDYSWHPENSRWINLDASLWTTRTKSKTNSSGGTPGDAIYSDVKFDRKFSYEYWQPLMYRNIIKQTCPTADASPQCPAMLGMLSYLPDPVKPVFDPAENLPNTDGRFNTLDGAAYISSNNRTGFNISNKMKLHDKLELTLMGDFQYETLKSQGPYDEYFKNRNRWRDEITAGEIGNLSVLESAMYGIAVPREGRRREWNFGFNFKFNPTDWLILNAGMRYTDYQIRDDYVKEHLQKSTNGYGNNWDNFRKEAGYTYKYKEVIPATADQARIYTAYVNELPTNYQQYLKAKADGVIAQDYDLDLYYARYAKNKDFRTYVTAFHLETDSEKVKNNPDIKKQVETDRAKYNPTGVRINTVQLSDGSYIIGSHGDTKILNWEIDEYGRLRKKDNPIIKNQAMLNEEIDVPAENGKKIKRFQADGTRSQLLRPLTESERQRVEKQQGHGWVPMLSATVFLTDYARVYARYSEQLRYPSIFEGTFGFSTGTGRLGSKWLPEHAKNWEIGYIQDLTGWIPSARYADVRLNYYHNTTKNVIDRDDNFNLYQYDRQILEGIELQGRFDFGRVFGDLGVTHTLRTQVCDEDYAYVAQENLPSHLAHLTVPVCQNGGMNGNGYLSGSIQPRWSVTANLGARFLNNKLELGTRFTYHSSLGDPRHKSFDDAGFPYGYGSDMAKPWNPVAIYDAYARYQINKNFSVQLSGSNLTNRYYLDPMMNSYMPAPGRTIQFGLTGKF